MLKFDQLKDTKYLRFFNTLSKAIKGHENNLRFWFLRTFTN